MIFLYAWCNGDWNEQGHSLGTGESRTNFSATQLAVHCLNDIVSHTADYLSERHVECQIFEEGEKGLGSIT